MRFTWFNLMPWPYLPDDFREKNRSVWVDIDSRLFDPVKSHEVYNNHLDLLEYAATLGFDGIGCNEHHQNAYGLMPSHNSIRAHGLWADFPSARRWIRIIATDKSRASRARNISRRMISSSGRGKNRIRS